MVLRRTPAFELVGCLVLVVACSAGAPVAPVSRTAQPAAIASATAAAATPSPTPTPAVKVALPVSFRPQRGPDWCDPADLEMWLELDGASMPGSGEVAIQQALWNYEVAHNDGFTLAQWHASPYAVAAAFDHFANRTDVGDAPFADAASAGAVISQSVAVRREPVIALVDRGSHYVLVSGVTLGSEGAAAPPTSVLVDDPWTYGPVRGDYAAMGASLEMTWADFVTRFTIDDPHDLGIWSGRWVLIAAGLPLRG